MVEGELFVSWKLIVPGVAGAEVRLETTSEQDALAALNYKRRVHQPARLVRESYVKTEAVVGESP